MKCDNPYGINQGVVDKDGRRVIHHPFLDQQGVTMKPYPKWPWWTFLWRERLKRAWRADDSNWTRIPIRLYLSQCDYANRLAIEAIEKERE